MFRLLIRAGNGMRGRVCGYLEGKVLGDGVQKLADIVKAMDSGSLLLKKLYHVLWLKLSRQ